MDPTPGFFRSATNIHRGGWMLVAERKKPGVGSAQSHAENATVLNSAPRFRLWLVYRGSTTPEDWWNDLLAVDVQRGTKIPGIFAEGDDGAGDSETKVGFAYGFLRKYQAVISKMRDGCADPTPVILNPALEGAVALML